MAEDSFKKFKKRYEEGKVPTLAMPPVPGAPGVGVARTIGMAAARTGLRGLKEVYDKAQKNAARNAKRREAAAAKKEARSKEKFGPLVRRQENMPAVREVGRRDLVVTRNQKRDLQPYKEGNKALVKREDKLPARRGDDSRALTVAREGKGNLARAGGGRTFGDKGQGGRIVGLSTKGKLALGAGAAAAVGAAAYNKAGGSGASTPQAGGGATYTNRDDRSSSLAGTSPENKAKARGGTKNGPLKSPYAQISLQGQKKKDKPKSRSSTAKPEKKLTNFERMKMRGYEKEGYGGRSMTSKGAKARVQRERSYKFKDLFKKK